VFLVPYQMPLIVAYDAIERHLFAGGKYHRLASTVFVKKGEGIHDWAVPVIVALERQDIEQGWHDPAVVVVISGAGHRLHLLFVLFNCLDLLNQLVQSVKGGAKSLLQDL
jgi:hypothetical protein